MRIANKPAVQPHLPRLGDKSTDLDLDLDPGGDLDDFHGPLSASDLYTDFSAYPLL